MQGMWRSLVARYPFAADGALAVGMLVISLMLGPGTPTPPWKPFDLWGALFVAVQCLSMTFRRRAPTTVMLFGLAVWLVFVSLGYWQLIIAYPMLLALYTAAALGPRSGRGGRRRSAWWSAAASGSTGVSSPPARRCPPWSRRGS
ncbi:hypothetical protein QLQ12_24810 [Actinoplanes sp. NEAU-A12]|uniref:DUF7134 domain-containing protein n=1 Tax=Actinoplanes sandaracinus TaxID=3045177 RepID=A0ABT6WQ60_9ACTN|nr:hypothetical protein [Actinoplanes sandaracinus]MDI6101848.1 hypothetical protein [Actinoplanes sandaracinus]